MNYYNPNFYQQYPYYQQTPQMQMPANPTPQPPQTLNGKIVDTIDMVKASEVPIGGYGIFPKADFTELYIKTWNQNGTTSIITYKPAQNEINQNEEDNITTLIKKVENMEKKLDELVKGDRKEINF